MSEEELPTTAEVVDKNGVKFPEPKIEHYNDLQIGDELVRLKDAGEKILDRMRELDKTNEDNWPILKELDALLCDLGCEDMAHEFREKADSEKKNAKGDTEC